MSPRLSFCLTLVGVLSAGVPLLCLTGRSAPEATAPAPPATPAEGLPVWVVVRCTGHPERVGIHYGGKELISAACDGDGVWEGEIPLPRAPRWELEVGVAWPEGQGGGAQAVGVSLSPPGCKEMTDTQWTFPGETELHSVFTFTPGQP